MCTKSHFVGISVFNPYGFSKFNWDHIYWYCPLCFFSIDALLKNLEVLTSWWFANCGVGCYGNVVWWAWHWQVLENIDELFDREELSAAPDAGWPDCFNSGVFVFCPSLDTYRSLLQFAVSHGSFDGMYCVHYSTNYNTCAMVCCCVDLISLNLWIKPSGCYYSYNALCHKPGRDWKWGHKYLHNKIWQYAGATSDCMLLLLCKVLPTVRSLVVGNLGIHNLSYSLVLWLPYRVFLETLIHRFMKTDVFRMLIYFHYACPSVLLNSKH